MQAKGWVNNIGSGANQAMVFTYVNITIFILYYGDIEIGQKALEGYEQITRGKVNHNDSPS